MDVAIESEITKSVDLLGYLPGIYHDDRFLAGFLGIFEAILSPLDRQIEQLHAYFNPSLTPAEFLPWLGVWFDLVLDENWPEGRRRQLIRCAVDLYQRRGTAQALKDYLAIYLGVEPEVTEDLDGPNAFHFTVTCRLDGPDQADEQRIRRIIEEEKPAHTSYTLHLEQR